MSKTIKKAAAFLRNGKIFLHPYSHTSEGFWIFSTPVLVTDENDKSIGKHVLTVLSKSIDNIPVCAENLVRLI